MMQNELAKLRLQALLESLGQQQEQAYNTQLAQQEALQTQLEATNYSMPTAQASSSYGDWNPMPGAPGNVGSTVAGNGIDPNDPYGIKKLLGNQTTNPVTTPVLTGAEALGPHVTWDGVDKRLAGDPFGIRQLIAGAGNTTVQNLTTPTVPTTTVPTTTVPSNIVQNSINGTNNPFDIQAKTTPITTNASITGDDDPYGIKALLAKQNDTISGLGSDLSFVKQQSQPKQNMGFVKDPYAKSQWSPTDMYRSDVSRETPSFNGGTGLGSLIRGA